MLKLNKDVLSNPSLWDLAFTSHYDQILNAYKNKIHLLWVMGIYAFKIEKLLNLASNKNKIHLRLNSGGIKIHILGLPLEDKWGGLSL